MKRKKMLIISALLFIILVCGCLFVSCNRKPQKTKTNQTVEVKESKSDSKKEKKEKDSEKIESQEETADQAKEEVAQKTTTENKTKAPSGETKVSSSGSKSTKDSSNVTPSTNKTPDNGKSTTTNSHTHTHDWKEEKTKVSHKEEGHWGKVCVKEAETEEVPVYETVAIERCSTCKADITGITSQHMKEHMLKGEKGGRYTDYEQRQTGTKTIEHPAEYKDQWIIDKEAWEEIVTIYKCSCGATK